MGDGYDVVVIGAGTGGYSAALRAAQLGKRVAIVERDDRLGGTCLLRGCIPTKALLQSAAVMDTVNRASEWGIKASGEPDWSAVKAFEDSIVDKLVKGVTGLIKARKIDVVHGTATLVAGPGRRGGRPVASTPPTSSSPPDRSPSCSRASRSANGSSPSDQALWYDSIPSSAVVIGAGAVGLEFASIYRSFGAEVTLIEALPRLAPLEDEEISKEVARAFRKRGIANAAGASVQQISRHRRPRRRDVRRRRRRRRSAPTSAWSPSAAARSPTASGSKQAGVSVHDKGFVNVDAQLRTNVDARVGGRRRRRHPAAAGPRLVHRGDTRSRSASPASSVPEIDYVNIPRVTYSHAGDRVASA